MDNWSGSSANSAGSGDLSELASGASSSDLTTTSVPSSRSTNRSDHHRYCDLFLRGDCTCDFVVDLEKRHAKRQLEKSLQSSRSSHQSAILAGHLNVSSQQSLEATYDSAIESCASASNILNQDINSASELSSANELHLLLRRISGCTLESTDDSETSHQEIMANLSQSFAQDPTNFTRRLVTIMEESELNDTLKQLLENYGSPIDATDTSVPTATDDTIMTPPDFILHRRGSKAVDLKTPKTPKRQAFGKHSEEPTIVKSMRELIKSPQKQSPGISNFVGTPGSMRSHNDSTFTALEKACGIITPGKMYSPDLREKARLEKIVAEQEKRLATKSPVENSNQATTAAASSQFIEEDSLDTDAPSHNQSSDSDEQKHTMAKISHSIIEEFEKKLQRFFETHRTMCEINAESSEASAPHETQSSGLISFLNLLTHVPGYRKYLKSDEIRRALTPNQDEKNSDVKTVNTPTEKRRVAKYFPTPDRTP